MACRHVWGMWLGLMACAFWAVSAASAQETAPHWTSGQLPLDEVSPLVRDKVRMAVEAPILRAQGQPETFVCNPTIYAWFLDHPDRAVAAWKLLGAKCLEIGDRGQGRFGWTDGNGSDVHWDTVYKSDRMRLMYAEGQVKPGLLLPTIPFQAVIVLRHVVGQDEKGRTVVRHQADLMLHTDSRSAKMVMRTLGTAAPDMAEQYVGQVETFFSALPWYIQKHPERAKELLAAEPEPPLTAEPRKLPLTHPNK